jgi:5-methylcytosine-specific restriction protein B
LEVYKAWVDRTSTPPPVDSLGEQNQSSMPTPLADHYTLDWLVRETQWNAEFLQELIDALTTRTPQIILAGPPGTSKTWLAQKLSEYLTRGDPRYQTTLQFHPSYSYEEFVEGLRPTAESGAIEFRPVQGHLLRLVARMDGLPGRHVLILDEINRANLPRVLGELLYLLEYRDRPIDLQYSKGFRLPARLLVIGTMNTADRSIRSLDAALRRRFDIFECPPAPDVLGAFYQVQPNSVADLVEGFRRLNDALTQRLDRHHTVGHAFFMLEEMTHQRLLSIWKYKVFPLIEEYFFDQPDVLTDFAVAKFWPSVADLV